MAFSDIPSPPGAAGTRGFDSPPPDFTGQPRDFPGPVERGPVPLFLPAIAAPARPPEPPPPQEPAGDFLENAPQPAPDVEPVSPLDHNPETAVPVVPEDTAFSLRQWSEALVRPAGGVPSQPAATHHPAPSVARAGSVSLAALADQLSARFIHDDAASPGAEDLLVAPDHPPLATPPAILTVAESAGFSPEPPAVPARVTASPAGIRAAAGLLSNPPRSVPARHQGDVFFLDHPTAAAPSAAPSLLDGDDFPGLLLDTENGIPADQTKPKLTPPVKPGTGWSSLLPGTPPDPLEQAAPGSNLTDIKQEFHPSLASSTSLPLPPAKVLPPPLPASVHSPDMEENPGEIRSLGLILGGVGLLIAGILLACRLPLLWLEYTASTGWDQHVLEATMLFHAGGALLAFVAGVGSLLQSRGAINLTLAAGWLAVFTSALFMGIAGFLLGSDADWNPGPGGTVALLGSLLLPLGYLLYYEKLSHHAPGEIQADPGQTPPRSVPLLMVLLSTLTVFTAAVSLLLFAPAVPLPTGTLLTGPPAQAVWTGIALIAALAAFCAWFRHRAAWWLLLIAVLGVIGTLSVSALAGIPAWSTLLHALGRPAAAAPPGLFWTPALGLAPLILLLVLAMARRSFVSPRPSP